MLDLCESGLEVLGEDPTTFGDGGLAGGLKLAGREEQEGKKKRSQARDDCSLTHSGAVVGYRARQPRLASAWQ